MTPKRQESEDVLGSLLAKIGGKRHNNEEPNAAHIGPGSQQKPIIHMKRGNKQRNACEPPEMRKREQVQKSGTPEIPLAVVSSINWEIVASC